MRFVEEIVVDRFLPTVRSLLAEQLRADGMTQEEVAETLGISQSAVSKYAAGAVTREAAIVADPQVRTTVSEVAAGLGAGEMTPTEALIELEVLVRQLEDDGVLAALHQQAEPALRDLAGFGPIHAPDSPARERAAVLASLRRGLHRLTAIEPIAEQIPAVGMNLVEATTEATDRGAIAAVPGRIIAVKGTPVVPADPEFGVSGHVAAVLLAARDAGVSVRAAVNLAPGELLSAAGQLGIETVEYDPTGGAQAVTDRVSDAQTTPLIVHHPGAFGIEPMLYVLGADAPTVAGHVDDLLGARPRQT
ncbi:MAG: thiamine-phosphate synthase family protein [Haloquadratum sp.]|jgi:predicted fused transcriptional regulator/phosphomethylpyrimidine kinase/predicted transcriptional regulator|nr:thiamine-phosphate synthase family protein [Haloferacaceae archaeon]MDR9444553.1 thiamine-phosphate synthase family protein [Haloquadratum sp.]